MTATAAMPARPRRLPALATDTWVVAHRHLIRTARTRELIIAAVVTPVLFLLLFRYIFGGAIPVPGMSYVDYLIPALLVQNAIFDGFATASALAVDARDGVVDRFRSLPMARSAVFTGRALCDLLRQAALLVILLAAALATGFRFHASALSVLAGLGLCLAFGQVLFWVFATIGFGTANPETAAAMTTPFFLLVFVSSAFIPVSTLPGWLQPAAREQPVSQFIDAVRCLTQGAPAGQVLGHSAAYFTLTSLLWSAGIVAVFATLARRSYRKL
ncbi:MAG TPA: ABC transporter [Actinobacteria bacterium]|nr:ABC transporter [Actinomycetota bacterium]